MSSRKIWQGKSFLVVIALIVILLILAPFSLASSNNTNNMDINKVSIHQNGTTVFAGDELIDSNKVNKYPIATNLKYLTAQLLTGDILGSLFSIATGTAVVPTTELVKGNVTDNGHVSNFESPGYVEIKDNHVYVHSSSNYIWGYNSIYTEAIKTDDGIDIVNLRTNQTIKHIVGDDIHNDTIGKDYIPSGDTVKTWYNSASVGSKYILQYCIAGINDGRAYIAPDLLKEKFPDAYNYSKQYPTDSPVVLYSANYTEIVVAASYTYLGDHSEYGNDNREYNAKQFAKGWNNTIIPPNATACGKDGIGFISVADPDAKGGQATHGVCPSARVLRNCVMSLGITLPLGMDTGQDAVLFGFSPTTGIKITNTLDYPIKIIMWTEGSGTDMSIHCKLIGYMPNSSTSITNSTVS